MELNGKCELPAIVRMRANSWVIRRTLIGFVRHLWASHHLRSSYCGSKYFRHLIKVLVFYALRYNPFSAGYDVNS